MQDIRVSNEKCKIYTDIRSDICEPILEIKFSLFKLNLFKNYNNN